MATKVVMEALSPTMEEGTLVKWLKTEGDHVATGDTLAEVETDKAVMELVARGSGVLRRIVAIEGATLEVGQLVGVIAEPDEDISSIKSADGASSASKTAGGTRASKAAPTPPPATTAAPNAPESHKAVAPTEGGRVKASPLARRLASERGIALTDIQGSGPGGRVIKRDLEGVTATSPGPAAAVEYEDVALSQIRKTIARRLVESIGPIPHFFLTSEIDMERAAEAREALNALEDGPRISYNDIILKVVAEALVRHPECNAWWQGDRIRYFRDAHLSVAVAIEGGLITPVIRHANRKTMREIAVEIRDLSARAKEKRLPPDAYQGGTFSVSNLGMFDIHEFTGVINPPEAGLLAVGAITQQPVIYDGTIQPRRRMRVTMSCDHRVIDGATGAKFLQTVRRMLENPLAMVW